MEKVGAFESLDVNEKKTDEKTRKPTKTKLFWCVGTLYDHFMTKQKVYQPCVSHLTALIGQIWCFTTNIGTELKFDSCLSTVWKFPNQRVKMLLDRNLEVKAGSEKYFLIIK